MASASVSTVDSPFEPVKVGPLTLRNRFIKSGANEAMCVDGRPSKALVEHHRDLAERGGGMTTVAYMAVAPEGRTLPNQVWMRPDILPDLKVLTAAVHQAVATREPDVRFGEMYFREYSRIIRAAVNIPLAYLGGVKSLANATQAIADGFDCVVLARALLHDPDLVNKLRSGELTRSGCDNCNGCVAYIYHPAGTRCVWRPPNDPALNRIAASAISR